MALRTPPSWLQQGSHPAENDRLTTQAIFSTTGIIGSTSLAVTQNGTPNMSVNVAAGWAAILSSTANAGMYVAYNDATTNLTVTAANASLPRIDRVVVTVNDAYYSGLLNNVTFTVVAGTAAASPTAPATPSNSISLATIAVAAAATSIVTANITDTRVATTTPLVPSTFTGVTVANSTLTNNTMTGATLEGATLIGTGFAGYTFYVTTNGAIQYITAASTANGTVNIASTSGVSLNTLMAVNQSLTIVLALTNTGTAYYPNAWQIDGVGVTPKWATGTAPTGGNASAIDVYTLNIIKTAASTYTVLASQTKFA